MNDLNQSKLAGARTLLRRCPPPARAARAPFGALALAHSRRAPPSRACRLPVSVHTRSVDANPRTILTPAKSPPFSTATQTRCGPWTTQNQVVAQTLTHLHRSPSPRAPSARPLARRHQRTACADIGGCAPAPHPSPHPSGIHNTPHFFSPDMVPSNHHTHPHRHP